MASITAWVRLEPHARAGLRPEGPRQLPPDPLRRGLEARVRDPAWMLARQWQVGEFLGDDAGSPIDAQVRVEAMSLTSYRPSLSGPASPLDTKIPLETHIEREPVRLSLRGAVQLGLRFEAMLAAAGQGAHVGAFRTSYPVVAQAPAGEVPEVEGDRFRRVAAGHVTNGLALIESAVSAADLKALAPIPSLSADPVVRQDVADVVKALLDYRDAVYSEPKGDSAWVSERLEYEFSLGSESQTRKVPLEAREFNGGRLDWHSVTIAGQALSPQTTAAVTVQERRFVPNNVSFHGMPNARWWAFEDAQTDFGKVDVERVDLAKLVVIEFALVQGNDWFQLPVSLPAGSLGRVTKLSVTNTFGETTEIHPTGEQVEVGERPWSMFRLSNDDSAAPMLFLPPALGTVDEGPDIEAVLFERDESAAIGWAIERKLQGLLDAPIDGYEAYFERLRRNPPPGPPTRAPGGPAIRYLLGTTVPDNWIPLVPVKKSEGSFRFRRGRMGAPGGTPGPPARGQVLEPWHPFYVADEAVPRAGVCVARRFRRARTPDGHTWLWVGRRVSTGRGEGSSGLEFDRVEDLPEPP